MAGRKKGNKCREKVQVHATFTFQQSVNSGTAQDPARKDFGGEEDKDTLKAPKAVATERLSFAEHAIKILDHMMMERSVGELLKLGPREEMLGLTPLSMAAAVGHVDGTRKLLEAGAAVDVKSNDGSTALLNAAHWRHLPVLDLLLQHGADVTATNNEGNNALMVALRHGDVRAVNSLWPHRKNLHIDHANSDGCTAIHLAAERKWESCVQFLIQNGANVNKQNKSGQTALHMAASKGDQPTAERLLAAGASLLLEDHCGNSPFCLAVRAFHDFLAGYFLTKLKPEDKLYLCKRRVQQLQGQLSADSSGAWNTVSFLTSDPSLRDALHQCDVMRVAVQALGRRTVLGEVAVQTCLLCSDLMYNPFPVPDVRFVKQFLSLQGPTAVLDCLDSRRQEHVHSSDSKELVHLQGYAQGQLQTRQQQTDFNTAFILLPIMAMTDTSIGRSWFTESSHQQRVAVHLRRVTSYRDLLQLVGMVQHDTCTRQVKVDRVAIMERFVTFFNTLESRDHEEKVRQLLEQEEREKSRKEKKREKKRQQRMKQKLKTKALDPSEDVCSKDEACIGDTLKTRSQSLDALDEIPLTVGPGGVQDVHGAGSAVLLPSTGQDTQGSEDEWVMVGGKRCYPVKVRSTVSTNHEESSHEHDPTHLIEDPPTKVASACLGSPPSDPVNALADDALQTAPQASQSHDSGSLDPVSSKGRQVTVTDAGCKANKGFMRWADVARHGSPGNQAEESASCINKNTHSEAEPSDERKRIKGTPKRREGYRQQFPSLVQPAGFDTHGHQQMSPNEGPSGNYGVEVLGAAHQFLERLFHSSGLMGRLPQVTRSTGHSCAPQPPPNAQLNPSVLYEALTGWMWQAAVAQGLISPDSEAPLGFKPTDMFIQLTNQLPKPKAVAGSQPNTREHVEKYPSYTKLPGCVSKQSTQSLNTGSDVFSTQQSVSTTVKDWFDITKPNTDTLIDGKRPPSLVGPVEHNHNPTACMKSKHEGTDGPTNYTNVSTTSEENHPSPLDAFQLKKESKSSSVEHGTSDGPFLWAGGRYTHWLPSYHDGPAPSTLGGKTVLESSGLYGLPVATGLGCVKSLEFPAPRKTQHRSRQKADSSTDLAGYTSSLMPFIACDGETRDKRLCKVTQSAIDHDNRHVATFTDPTPSMNNTTLCEEYAWLCQDSPKDNSSAAMGAFSRSSESDCTHTSFTEHIHRVIVDDACSLTSDTSRSSCLSNNPSSHQLSPPTSRGSSFTGLHECLAPGFLRAATGDTRSRPFGMVGDVAKPEECKSSLFRPVSGNLGLLPTAITTTERANTKGLNRHYPDLSTVPERDQSPAIPSTLPLALRVVGQGRPRRSEIAGGGDIHLNRQTISDTDAGSAQTRCEDSTTASADGISINITTCSADRPLSPDVLFPESLRDKENEEQSRAVDVFPSIHDMNERDLFQDVFSNSYFLEQIAIDQIRRRLRSMGSGDEILKKNSVLFHDLDYYASLYGVRLRDILGPQADSKPCKGESAAPKKTLDQSVPAWKAVVKELGRRMNSKEDLRDCSDLELPADWEDTNASEWPWSCKVTAPQIVAGPEVDGEEGWWQQGAGSRRWRTWLRQILDMPWTMRRQYGKIVLPARSMQFNIGRTGRHPLILGFLTDGTEVGVLALDRTRHELDTRLMATVAADSEPDVHFVLRYKAVWECAGRVYLAMELCDYTLDEYVGIVRLDHRQDPLSANRLAWQLLKGLKYLHSNFAVPHGNLMVAGMLLHYILTGGRHLYGDTGTEVEANLSGNVTRQQRVSQEADHLVSTMTVSDPLARPSVDVCLKHPFFWSGEKRFRLVLIVGSDILTEMKTGVPLTGAGSTSMVDILNIVHISTVSDNWLAEVDIVLMKEMRAFRQYKNNLPELVLFVYNCCLHYDKMSTAAKEVLDDPCKYFQSRFTALFMAVYRAMRASDRTDRTCYKPFF